MQVIQLGFIAAAGIFIVLGILLDIADAIKSYRYKWLERLEVACFAMALPCYLVSAGAWLMNGGI